LINLSISTETVPVSFFNSDAKSLKISIKRLDLIHPSIGGNKIFKLKYNLLEALQKGHSRIVTFGGAYSNHIAATALAGNLEGIETIGIIRGEEPAKYSKTLIDAKKNGMQLHFISRKLYRSKNEVEFKGYIHDNFGSCYIIPEGGANELGVKGCEEILDASNKKFDYIIVACGTGGTISGLIRSCDPQQQIIGIPVLHASKSITETIQKYTQHKQQAKWKLIDGYAFGGYAKTSPVLNNFISNFIRETSIPIEPVYTGKLMHAVQSLIDENYFNAGSKILILHTGGLQYLNHNKLVP
jgi:1-aminocyclopropane-1-carboxylate deaminase/D-cysteine desulfhydrase-like pyridoxal-dependent ACC family enzyme